MMGFAIALPILRKATKNRKTKKENWNNRYGKNMTDYRRYRVKGGTYFFTVNLVERKKKLLTEHIDVLRTAFHAVKQAHPFQIEAVVILPDHLHTIWTLPEAGRATVFCCPTFRC